MSQGFGAKKKSFTDKSLEDISQLHIPPHNIEAEQACLGACLIDAEALDRISEVLSGPDDFYRDCLLYTSPSPRD